MYLLGRRWKLNNYNKWKLDLFEHYNWSGFSCWELPMQR